MKLIFKSFHNKKNSSILILILLVLMSLFSFQSAATITFTSESTLDKIDSVNGYHTSFSYSVMYESSKGGYKYDTSTTESSVDSYIATLNTKNNVDILESYVKVHTTTMYFSVLDTYEDALEDYVDISIVTGYSNENNMNDYEVIEGKELTLLDTYELAIPYQYNQELIALGIDYKDLYFYDEVGNQYSIVSIYNSPNYISEVNTSLSMPEDTSLSNKTSSEIENYYILGNETQLEYIYETYKEESFSTSKVTYLMRITDYSEYMECVLSTFLIGTSYSHTIYFDTYEVNALYYEMQSETVAENVFQYLVYTMLLALIVADIFVFYSFIKRKLEENKERIGIMLISGIKKVNIIVAFIVSNLYVFITSCCIYIYYSI